MSCRPSSSLRGRRSEFYLATKTSARDRDGAAADLEKSLDELQFNHIDLWQLHTVANMDSWREVMATGGALETAQRARSEGLIGHVGISVHRSLEVMRRAIECGEFETIMLTYNPMDSECVADFLPLAKQHDMGTIAMKALGGGRTAYPKQNRQAGLGGLDALVAGCLRLVLSNESVDCVIPGMEARHEVEENVPLAAPVAPLGEAERQTLMRLLGEFDGEFRYEQKCLRCGYCQPCPEGVDVPAIFRAAVMVRRYPDNLKHQGYEIYEALKVGAEACVECKECLEKCPAGLPIPEMLKEAHQLLRRR